MLRLLCVSGSTSLHCSTFPHTLLSNFNHSPADTVANMIFAQLILLLMSLSTLTLGAPAADPVNDVARQQSRNLQKRVIIPYIPHARCVVKGIGQHGVIDYPGSWAATSACCVGCSKFLAGKNCELFCDPRVGTCCQMGDVKTSGFASCCRHASVAGGYFPRVELCNPSAHWPPGRNNCNGKRSVIEKSMFDYELDYEVDVV
ncbi:hypothetical protein IWZ03DRAFT_385071 [Phyllosticta citriasiana]|uniref:Uncharacterized protein n=1 Tax=Phyllosticta citriasiana TaxID=595635 RepID=A0ABR1KFG1_9PEZI